MPKRTANNMQYGVNTEGRIRAKERAVRSAERLRKTYNAARDAVNPFRRKTRSKNRSRNKNGSRKA